MKKRNLIATNCPPGVECDGKSADDSDKPGKLPKSKHALGPVDSQKFRIWSESMPKPNSLD